VPRRPRLTSPLALVVVLAVLAAGCGAPVDDPPAAAAQVGASTSVGVGADAPSEDPADHADHEVGDRSAPTPTGDTTADTLAQMLAMDPQRAARAHQHDGHHAAGDHDILEVPLRNPSAARHIGYVPMQHGSLGTPTAATTPG
jgi:hypothetical protein